jgi:hypothetical protein
MALNPDQIQDTPPNGPGGDPGEPLPGQAATPVAATRQKPAVGHPLRKGGAAFGRPPAAHTLPKPPRPLGKAGMGLWRSILEQYAIEDAGGRELLHTACSALDRAEALRKQIDEDGEIVTSSKGIARVHPGLKMEMSLRGFVCRTLAKLGLNVEPLRPGPGRPGKGSGWDGSFQH